MIPGHVNPAVVQLPSDAAYAPGAAAKYTCTLGVLCRDNRLLPGVVLIAPLPVDAPDHPGPRHHVPHHVGPQRPPRLPHRGLSLLSGLAQLVTDTGDLNSESNLIHPGSYKHLVLFSF